jgi:hypothetical protein
VVLPTCRAPLTTTTGRPPAGSQRGRPGTRFVKSKIKAMCVPSRIWGGDVGRGMTSWVDQLVSRFRSAAKTARGRVTSANLLRFTASLYVRELTSRS